MPDQPYLLIGGSGKLGRMLLPLLACDAPTHAELDILQPDQLPRIMKGKNYTAVIHLAAITQATQAEKQPLEAYRVNVLGTRNVAKAAAAQGLKVFYLSTDYVFDGVAGDYGETDVPKPANWYGATKYAGELELQEAGGPFAIFRTSFRPIQWGFPTAYTNVYTSADYVDVIAAEVAQAIRQNIDGTLHIGTPVKTFYDLAVRRNPEVRPEVCQDPAFPKRRNLNIDRWLAQKKEKAA